ncbi:DUF2177 family protein [Clostridia bacterium]|nr:DUF2177 family protein [Clostridia bacterium]
MKYIWMYLISLAVFLAIDMVWLNFIAKALYQRELGYLMADKFNLAAAFIFYAIFVAGLMYFSIYPAFVQQSVLKAVLTGAFFGLVSYATYDLTNMATVRDWPLLITLVDLVWGATLGATTSSISYLIFKRLF